MTVAVASLRKGAASSSPLTAAAALPVSDVLDRLGSGPGGRAGCGDGRGRVARQPVRPHAGLPAAPRPVLLALVVMVVAYLLMIELGKYWFYRSSRTPTAAPPRRSAQARRPRVHRRAARFTTHHRLR